MRPLVVSCCLIAFPFLTSAAGVAPADDSAACSARHALISKQAAGYHGDIRIKRLIDADLKRALKEQAEGDNDECIEALDHATKLLAGDI